MKMTFSCVRLLSGFDNAVNTVFYKYRMRKWIDLFEEHAALDEDEVWEIIHQYADELEGKEGAPYNEVYGIETQSYPQLFIAGYPEDGFSLDVAKSIVEPLNRKLVQGGWMLAKQFETKYDESDQDDDDGAGEPQILTYFGWFPSKGSVEDVSGEELFHVCRAENADLIRSGGLRLSQGGSDFIHTSNARVYAVIGYDGIHNIARDLLKHRGWNDLHVFQIEHEMIPNIWYEDMELQGLGVWTDSSIPPHALTDYGPYDDLL